MSNLLFSGLQDAEKALANARPKRPVSAFDLFSTSLKRQYNIAEDSPSHEEALNLMGQAWQSLPPADRAPFEDLAEQDMQRYLEEQRVYEDMQTQYLRLKRAAQGSGLLQGCGYAQQPQQRYLQHHQQQQQHPQQYNPLPHPVPQPPPPQQQHSGPTRQQQQYQNFLQQQHQKQAQQREALARQLQEQEAQRRQDEEAQAQMLAYQLAQHLVQQQHQQQPSAQQRQEQPRQQQRRSSRELETADAHASGRKWAWKGSSAGDRDRDRDRGAVASGEAEAARYGGSQSVSSVQRGSGRGRLAQGGRRPGRGLPTAERMQSGGAAAAAAGGQPGARQGAPWRDGTDGNFVPIHCRFSGERCAVCDADTDNDVDQLIACDMCGVTVHQSCYGVGDVPGVEDMWLCRACELQETGRPAPQCCLCPVTGGALKPTTISGIWCHVTCLQWVPEVSVDDVDLMEPVSGVRSIQRERWELVCCVCKQRMGAKVQCEACFTAYHPLCARIAGYFMEISDGADGSVSVISYCSRHRPPQPQNAGVRKVEDSETYGDLPDSLDASKLCNGQPYELPPPAPRPRCPGGCARASRLDCGLVRRSHGTGIGATTEGGFWIPGSEVVVAAAAAEEEAQKPRESTPSVEIIGENPPPLMPSPEVICLVEQSAGAPNGSGNERDRERDAAEMAAVTPSSKRRRIDDEASPATAAAAASRPSFSLASVLAGRLPEALADTWCRVWWPEDAEWWVGAVREYRPTDGQYRVWYEADNKSEWIDLEREGRNGRLQMLPPRDQGVVWPPPPPPPPGPHSGAPAVVAAVESPLASPGAVARPRSGGRGRREEGAAGGEETGPAGGAAAVGRRVGVWWDHEDKFFYGTVRSFRADQSRHLVLYDDGTADWVDLKTEKVNWSKQRSSGGGGGGGRAGRRASIGSYEEEKSGGGGEDGAPAYVVSTSGVPMQRSLPAHVPDSIDVVCNGVRGTFWLRRLMVKIKETGDEVSPTEFERGAGRSAAKRWKSSIRLDKGGGAPGTTMEAWLISMGIDSKPGRPSKGTAATVQRRQAARSCGGGDARGAARTGHRAGCTCVVCKQMRRTGKRWSGGGEKSGAAVGNDGDEDFRWGKRAYLEALPHVVASMSRAPPSRCWTPAEWAAHRLRHNLVQDASAAGEPLSRVLARAPPPVLLAGGAAAVVEGNLAAAVSLGPGTTGCSGGGAGGRTLSMKEKLELCNATAHERLAFGKSGIHGWGLFARVPMRQDAMVVEFRGELLRRGVADKREAAYLAQGADCYIFNLDDDWVLDATHAGTIARFTNHSCSPSLYTRIMSLDGELRLAFFAREDILPGQELTYNYRFESEDGEERMPCCCGAPNCVGFLN